MLLLYERTRATGSRVRIRRVSARGATPVIAVLECATTTARPLPLLEVVAETEIDALVLLEPYARSESAIARLSEGFDAA
jgi:hypothetical protein